MARFNTDIPDANTAEIAATLRTSREWTGTDDEVLQQWLDGIVAGEVKTSTLRTANAALKAAKTDAEKSAALLDIHELR